jgi:NADH-quinone oxidoreductase subunit E
MQQAEMEMIEPLLGQFENRRMDLIPILQEIQSTFSYLPQEVLRRVSRKLQVPLTEVYQVATFYRCFSLVPRGKHLVQVCLGTACHVRGADVILERVRTETGTVASATSADLQFTVEPVRCLGCCGLAPVMRVDRDTIAHLEQNKIHAVLRKYRPKVAKIETAQAAAGAKDVAGKEVGQ